jgi:hypothetical protein
MQFTGAHLAVADGDPDGELGRSGAARLLRDRGGRHGDDMPLRRRPPPRAAARARGARERGVERRRGVLLREREREVAAVRRWRREEEVERGGSREHLEPEVEARRRAWGVRRETTDERVATRPRTLSLSPPPFCLPPCGFLNREILPWGFGILARVFAGFRTAGQKHIGQIDE